MTAILRKESLTKGLKVTLFSLVLPAFLIFTFSISGSSLEPSASDLTFHVATVDKMTGFPVHWVAAGRGVLAYGAGQDVDFALVNEPFSPVSHLSFDGTISGALIFGRYAYLAQEDLGLRIIDLEVPSNPVDMGFYSLSGSTFHLANDGNLLFVGGGNGGVQIFELSYGQQNTMDQPQFTLIDRGTIPVEESITAFTADQGKLYVATQGKDVKVYDVSDPYLPFEVAGLPVGLLARSLAVNGNTLFVGAGTEGLHVFDLSVPGKPETVATYAVPSESLYLAGRLVYSAAGTGGLHLLEAGPIATATFNVQVGPGGGLFFSPDPVNVNAGDTVNWVWGSDFHSTTSGTNCPTSNGIWDSGVHNVPFQFPFTFNTPGSFSYFCSVHCFVGTVNVSGANAINISVSPTSLDFGNVNVGSSLDLTITIMNETTSTGALTGSVGTLSAPFSIVSGGGTLSLPPGQSRTVTVRFSPASPGAASGNLSITHNATNPIGPTSIPLSGNGVTAGPVINISVTPASVNFGNVTVGQSQNRTVTITNEPGSTAALTGSVGVLTVPFSVASGGGAFTLAVGQSMPVTVSFSPTAAGAASGNLLISHNATNHTGDVDVSLNGTGMEPSGPNVVITSVSGPSTGKPGGRIPIQSTMTNQGNQKASGVKVNFFLSTDTIIDTGDMLIGKRSIMSLGSGLSSAVSTRVTIPRTVTPGSYFIGAMTGNNTNFDQTPITICLSLSKSALLSPKNRGTTIPSTPTLDWSDVTGASSYTVQVATDSNFTNIVTSMSGLTASQWTVTPALAGNTKYFWRVMAVNDCGSGPLSATSSFTTLP